MQDKKLSVFIIITALVAVLSVFIISNIKYQPPCGDPENKRLQELANDTIFGVLPEDAIQLGPAIKTPASFENNIFESSDCLGASVTLNVKSDRVTSEIYTFYSSQAIAAGWSSAHKTSAGYSDRWEKTYPDGAKASLVLHISATGTNRTVYNLEATTDPVYTQSSN